MNLSKCYLTLASDPGRQIISEIARPFSCGSGSLSAVLQEARPNAARGDSLRLMDLCVWCPDTGDTSYRTDDIWRLLDLYEQDSEPRVHPHLAGGA